MGTGEGVGAQFPAEDRPVEPGWRPDGNLSPLEEEMVAGAAAGELVDRGAGPFTLAEMQAWGEERTVRAAVLRHLLVAGSRPVHAKGVRLRGVRISGHLDLEAATLRCPLSLECCYLDADDPARLDHATASRVTLTGCELAGLTGEMLTARELDLSGSTLTGPLVLLNADIAGGLSCRGARLTGADSDGYALLAAGIKARSGVFLTEGFTAAGAVLLFRADITGVLVCSGARLTGTDSDGSALAADEMKVGDVHLTGGFTAAGAVCLSRADITGQLICGGARLNGIDSDGNALFADGMKVGGGVRLNEFTAAGAVRLLGSEITGQLNCDGAKLAGTDSDGNALFADGMKVGGGVRLNEFTAAGAVRLRGAEITGQLICGGAQLNGTDSDGNALAADGIKVSEVVSLGEGFTAAGAVCLSGADITGQLRCDGAHLTGRDSDGYALAAAGIKVGQDVSLGRGFTAAGAVCLTRAEISGALRCDGAHLGPGDHNGNALAADGIKVGQVVSLGEGFTAAGAVCLTRAEISGALCCDGAHLGPGDHNGNALAADGIKVGGDVSLGEGFTAAGAVQLGVADIAATLSCDGAHLTGRDSDGYALAAGGIKVGGDVSLGEGFTAAGAVQLGVADIAGELRCGGAWLIGTDSDGYALAAGGIKARSGVFLTGEFTAAGAVWLADAEISGQLRCDGAHLTGRDSDGYALAAAAIKCGNVSLGEGFTAAGAVCLSGAHIAGVLLCSGARLTGRDSDGYALAAGGIKCEVVSLGEGFTAAGAVQLGVADIAATLSCDGAHLTGRDSDGYALAAAGIKVGQDVSLGEGFTAAGAVCLTRADITGQLRCDGAHLGPGDHNGNALIADGMKVGDAVFLDGGFTAAGALRLLGADIIGPLRCDGAHLTGTDSGSICAVCRWDEGRRGGVPRRRVHRCGDGPAVARGHRRGAPLQRRPAERRRQRRQCAVCLRDEGRWGRVPRQRVHRRRNRIARIGARRRVVAHEADGAGRREQNRAQRVGGADWGHAGMGTRRTSPRAGQPSGSRSRRTDR